MCEYLCGVLFFLGGGMFFWVYFPFVSVLKTTLSTCSVDNEVSVLLCELILVIKVKLDN